MTVAQIESNILYLIKSFSKETFIYDLLLSYGLPKSSITRLQKGTLNLSKNESEIIWKKKLFYRAVADEDLHLAITKMIEASNHNERFIIVTDYHTLLAIDTKINDRIDIAIKDLPKHYDFFLPWAGMEKAFHQDENPADVNAAVKMAKLFDEIRKDNPNVSPEFLHNLNVFLSRLLFCFFAEDTNIFEEGQFTNAIDSHTREDGSDLNEFFNRLFEVLNTPNRERKSLPDYLDAFPYVNGGLFRDIINSPIFTRSSRRAILNSGDQNWSAINPDIFGSMFQAVVSDDQRGNLGQHYTSVPNIMKVIKPLFLDELYESFKKNENSPQKLIDLLNRLGKIKIFDPACGSGNFLIIAYKELRKLEIKIIHRLLELQKLADTFSPKDEQLSFIPKTQLSLAASFQVDLFSRIQLNHFYGIEIDDFAHEIARLSLWLAEHQMNTLFFVEFGKTNPTLPLKEAGNIVCANACRVDWEKVCPKEKDDEIYILGNPPYSGYARQSVEQKKDIIFLFSAFDGYKKLDYISCWFFKAAHYIHCVNYKFAFVSTNSITQGEQVALLWTILFSLRVEIDFAYQSFKWTNNAKKVAGVTVVIICIRSISGKSSKLFYESSYSIVDQINPYLLPETNFLIQPRITPLSKFPEMIKGCSPGDNGNLILNENEKEELISNYPDTSKIIKPYVGAEELLDKSTRYCIWVDDLNFNQVKDIPFLKKRFDAVREFRLKSKKEATKNKASKPYKFLEIKYYRSNSIVIPQTTSENRKYIPIVFFDESFILSNAVRIVYNAQVWLFSILTSYMHNIWLQLVSGRLETRIQYSNTLSYNTFPFPAISDQRKQELTQTTFRILEEREKHSDKTLAELYDPDKMPEGLREAHHLNDLAVERCYRSKPFENDEERLEYLFKLYEQMIEEEKERDTLFAIEKNKSGRKRK